MKKINSKTEGMPALSVIIPVYNSERYLKKCLDSVIRQTFCDMEIIVVDDGSIDGSLQICNAYAELDSRMKVISKENGGSTSARKMGLSVARGKVIGFIDSDDWIEPEMYEQLMQCMDRTGCNLVSSGIYRDYRESGKSELLSDNYEEGFYGNLDSDIYPTMVFDERYKVFGLYCNLVNKIFRKDLLNEVYRNINEDVFYGEDALACYHYCLLSESIYIMHKAFYHYNIRSGSVCSVSDSRLPQNNYLLYMGLQDIFRKSDSYYVLMRQLKSYLIRLERHSLEVLYHINMAARDVWKFFYPDELFCKKIVIYGAGACGQALYRQICERGKEKNVVLWVDKRANELAEECSYPIQFPNALNEADWEILIIAVENRALAREIADEIGGLYGIETERIRWSAVEHMSS